MSLVTVVASAVAALVALVAGWGRASGIHELLGCFVDDGYDLYRGWAGAVRAHDDGVGGGLVVGRGFHDGDGFASFADGCGDGPDSRPIPLLGTVPETAPGNWVVLVPVVLGYRLWRCFGALVSAFSPVAPERSGGAGLGCVCGDHGRVDVERDGEHGVGAFVVHGARWWGWSTLFLFLEIALPGDAGGVGDASRRRWRSSARARGACALRVRLCAAATPSVRRVRLPRPR